jgi:hypothetical protein
MKRTKKVEENIPDGNDRREEDQKSKNIDAPLSSEAV